MMPHPLKRCRLPLLLGLALALGACQPTLGPTLQGRKAGEFGNYAPGSFAYWDLKHRDFTGAGLYRVDFKGADLSFASFRGADLMQADLREANLYRADFTSSNVHRAWLHGASLRAGIFDDTNFQQANFKFLDLRDATFRQAELQGADFTNARLDRADFSAAVIYDTDFSHANLELAKFAMTDLKGVKLHYLNLKGVDFSEANLTGVSFLGSTLDGANFSGAILDNTDFAGASVNQANFQGAKINKTNFVNSRLAQPNFREAELREVRFEVFDFAFVDFHQAYFQQVVFFASSLKGADFSEAQGEVLFQWSDLTGADFTKAQLNASRFDHSNLQLTLTHQAKLPSRVEPLTGIRFIQIPQGCYVMGDTFKETRGFEANPHPVCLDDFWLAETELTQEQFQVLRGKNIALMQGKEPNLPMESMDLLDSLSLVFAAQEKTGWKLRLPTEAEWEYACREMGKKRRFGNGVNEAESKQVAFQPRRVANAPGLPVEPGFDWDRTVPVKIFKPNALGLYGMSGNVGEVVADMWHPEAYSRHSLHNPLEQTGQGRPEMVMRGGGWFSGGDGIACAKRDFVRRDEAKPHVGLRLAWEGP